MPRLSVGRPRSRGGRWAWRLGAIGGVLLVASVVTRGMGFSAMSRPSAIETRLALFARSWLMPADARSRLNGVPASPEVLESGMAHWADHCATCHGNDGRGQTSIGRSLYPPAPDMRGARTQEMTDGELFYVIEHGVPLTGMPGWRTGTKEGERLSWELVRFIRHLPSLTADDLTKMEALNPRSAAQIESEKQTRDFLKGGGNQ